MKNYYVYMLMCSDKSYYIGVTNDYRKRVFQHKEGVYSNAYTYQRRPIELVYVKEFDNIRYAISWEKQIKRWSRKKKEALIKAEFDKLRILSLNTYMRKIDVVVRQAHHDIARVISCSP